MDMPSVSPQHVTQLLSDWSHGDDAALAELTPLVYKNSDASLIILWRDSVPSTHCKRRRWSTRLTCAWPARPFILLSLRKTGRDSSLIMSLWRQVCRLIEYDSDKIEAAATYVLKTRGALTGKTECQINATLP